MASVGFSCPTGKTIMFVRVKLEYSHNVNSVIFDNIRMVKAQYSKVKHEAELEYDENTYSIKDVTAIKYTKNIKDSNGNTIATPITLQTDGRLQYDDIRKIQFSRNIYLHGAIRDESSSLKSNTAINLVIGTSEINVNDVTIKVGTTTQTENGNGIKTRTVSDEYGNPTQTEITDENGITSKFTYGYDLKHNLITEIDERRSLTKTYQRNSYGNVTNTTLSVVGDSDETNVIKQVTGYNSNGNYSQTTYDERYTKDGALLYTTTSYDNTSDQLNYVVLPNGEKINYDYYSDGSLMGISCHIDGASGTCTCDSTIQTNCSCTGCSHITYEYTLGLLTQLKSNTAKYNFEYDGFGVVTSVKLNNTEMLSLSYKNNCTYVSGTAESEYDYTQVNYANGHKSKEILDKNQNIISKKYITPSGTEHEILRQGFDEKGKILQSVDKSVSVCYNVNGESDTTNKDLTYTYAYKDNGTLDKITYSGYRTGSIQHVSDKQGRATESIIKFGEEKNYSYEYEKFTDATTQKQTHYADNRIKSIRLPNTKSVNYDYDNLGRFKKRNVLITDTRETSETYTYQTSNYDYSICKEDRTTTYVSRVRYEYNVGASSVNDKDVEYTYDKNGNIENIRESGLDTKYYYDGIGRLVREDNSAFSKTYQYRYDTSGNITSVYEASYGMILMGTETLYTYDTTHKDRLISHNGLAITYDALGNPINYKGNLLTWTRGRLLNSFGTNKYYYDINGIRQEKIVNGVKHTYYTEGERIHKEIYGDNTLWYYYDQTGVAGFNYNGTDYYYQKNLQGDIIRILDNTGTVVARYAYDAWGNHAITLDTIGIGAINPFRYRGYYYDTETGLYYLNSRYYDPQVRRFINADGIDYLEPENVNGLNLYSYCGNNPVNYYDPSGHFAISALILCALALVGMGLTVGGVATDNNVMTAIGLTMVAVPALISGIGALFSGATYLSIIGGVTAGAGLFTGVFATAEYQEAFTGNNWIMDITGMSEEWYNGLMLATAAIATAGTIATGVLTSIGNAATPNQMMNSFSKYPNRWKTLKELVEPGRGVKKGGVSTYSNYINKWTGSKLGIHKIIKSGRFIHGPHYHPWI